MSVTLKLSDLIDAIEAATEDLSYCLDKRSGEIILLTSEEIQAAEDDELISEYPDWQRESVLKAREVLAASEEFLELPDEFDINEYKIMEDFCVTSQDHQVGLELLQLIKGSGAFRRFKNAIRELGVESAWYEFKRKALEKIAIEWLEENEISYIKDDGVSDLSEAIR